MAINFPSSPVNGQTFTSGDNTWIWSSSLSAWELDVPGVVGPTGPSGQWDTAQIISTQTASYILLTSDAGKLITMNSSSGLNLTVNGSLDLTPGQRIDIIQLGTGQVTVVASGATVNGTPGLKLRAQYSAATLICVTSDTYVLLGDLSV